MSILLTPWGYRKHEMGWRVAEVCEHKTLEFGGVLPMLGGLIYKTMEDTPLHERL